MKRIFAVLMLCANYVFAQVPVPLTSMPAATLPYGSTDIVYGVQNPGPTGCINSLGLGCDVQFRISQIPGLIFITGTPLVGNLTSWSSSSSIGPATVSQVTGLFSGCSLSVVVLTVFGTCTSVGTGTITATGSPSASELAAFSGVTSIAPATSSEVIALWSGCGSSFPVLLWTGACGAGSSSFATPPGLGTTTPNTVAATTFNASAGIVSGSPTGGNQGAGTMNAVSVFQNGIQVGAKDLNVISIAATTFTLALTDDQAVLFHNASSATAWSGPNNSVDNLPVGAIVTVANEPGGGTITITPNDFLAQFNGATTVCPSGCTQTTLTATAQSGFTLFKVGATGWFYR
jgi:hypothetical protein